MKYRWGAPYILVFNFLFGLAGCASTQRAPAPPVDTSEQAVREADTSGARLDPMAAHYLNLARREVANARALIQGGEAVQAEWMLRRATADAQLAAALARENVRRAEAQELTEQLDVLRTSSRAAQAGGQGGGAARGGR